MSGSHLELLKMAATLYKEFDMKDIFEVFEVFNSFLAEGTIGNLMFQTYFEVFHSLCVEGSL